jgi:all-trans-8'-apo-beta-carotenal 15,15'-oxygenase
MSNSNPTWSKSLAPATEFPLTQLVVKSGAIPSGLQGTLYRNGPARLERGGKKVGHWFDGDGAILAVRLADGAASGVYRYVKTPESQAEAAADRFLYSSYGMTYPGPIWESWFKSTKNPANTSVIALQDRLLALWEGGDPYALDLTTLATIGKDKLGFGSKQFIYSAHPKVDPQTGDIYNFGISGGIFSSSLNVYQSDRTGKIVRNNIISLARLSLVHSFILTDRYLVFFIPPINVNIWSMAFNIKSYSDALDWQPDLGTEIVIVDRNNLEVISRSKTSPWFHWHVSNGYVDDRGKIICELVRNFDLDTNQYLKEMPSGETHTLEIGTLWQLTIDPQSGELIDEIELVDRRCEFPTIDRSQVGQEWRYTYISTHDSKIVSSTEFYETIGRYDRHTQTLVTAKLAENLYPTEPIHATDKFDPNRGWVLTVIFDGNLDRSEVWIFDRDRLDDEPVCILSLPSIVPISFHGTWVTNR